MTIAMLALAGIPGTVGFIGKFQLIHALVNGDYTWLAIVLVLGSMISLGYYLRVVASIWMRTPTPSPGPGYAALAARRGLAPIAGGSPEADAWGRARRHLVGARRRSPSSAVALRRRLHRLRDLPLAAVQPGRSRRPGHRHLLTRAGRTDAPLGVVNEPG